MKYVLLIPTITNLLSVTVWCQHQYHEVNLIKRLNEYFCFDHNIILMDSSNDHKHRYIITANVLTVTPQTIYIFDRNLVNFTDNDTHHAILESLTSKNTFLIVVANSSEFENNTKLLTEVEAIRHFDVNVKIGVLFYSNVTSMDIIKRLFRWSWSVQIVNIFCSFYSNIDDSQSFNVFRSDPFQTLNLINVTESESFQDYFPKKVPNYHNYPLRFLELPDMTHSDIDYKFADTVARTINASTSRTYKNAVDLKDFKGELPDIAVLETRLKSNFDVGYMQCYPHRITTTVLMAPHARPYSSFLVYLQNATWKLLITYSFIAISVASILLIVSGYLYTKKFLLFKCVADIINLLMNDNGAIRYGQLHRADICIIVPFTFTGLIVVNGILSVFQSYLTLPIYERQIDTIDDLFKSPFPILTNDIHDLDRTVEVMENISRHDGWGNKVRVVDILELWKYIFAFNNSIAFFADEHEARGLLDAQKRLSINAYHLLTETYLERVLVSFAVKKDYPFIEAINYIIHSLQSAGLIEKWVVDGDQVWIKKLWKRNLQLKTSNDEPSDNDEFYVPTVVWYGWIASMISFVCEMVWNKMKPTVRTYSWKLKKKLSLKF